MQVVAIRTTPVTDLAGNAAVREARATEDAGDYDTCGGGVWRPRDEAEVRLDPGIAVATRVRP
ncbi:hypothetical protein FHS29_004215 [Saccharothrix tamanrassetensis]|uniref:Uncharacterized protein n=1 Tax=Saccharothrix tamanrassetensis TaxID=1051531 RepID=A0A841CKM7_9PSEU|nr:hypothetical protein [Saccharothrix tamanrassetensis]MBB5957620.1 hypothetical protein [Saccharothrix tamanrassetensis]